MAKRRSRTKLGFAPGEPRTPSSRRLPTRPEGRPSPLDDLPNLIKVLQRELELTPREAEVLAWITIGKTNPEIAQILIPRCKPRTVDTHVRRIFTKLGVERRTAAARRVFEVLPPHGPTEPLP